jgi:hypothetical protein
MLIEMKRNNRIRCKFNRKGRFRTTMLITKKTMFSGYTCTKNNESTNSIPIISVSGTQLFRIQRFLQQCHVSQ